MKQLTLHAVFHSPSNQVLKPEPHPSASGTCFVAAVPFSLDVPDYISSNDAL